jgi:ribonuclease BN (tRNA processing enzyme)
MNQTSIFIIIIIFSACISPKRKGFNDALYWSTRYGEFPYLVLNVKTNNRSEKILLTSLALAALRGNTQYNYEIFCDTIKQVVRNKHYKINKNQDVSNYIIDKAIYEKLKNKKVKDLYNIYFLKSGEPDPAFSRAELRAAIACLVDKGTIVCFGQYFEYQINYDLK